VIAAEIFQPISKFTQSFRFRANDYSEKVFSAKARRRKGKTVLLRQKLFAEIYIVFDIFKRIWVNFDHEVHGCTALNWCNSRNTG
jgi:hypothetical protein